MICSQAKRLTLFAGHYGSGKTNLAVNYAIALRQRFPSVAILDLDIVNPYFRTKDSEARLAEAGVTLISSAFANSNVDLPALPSETYRPIQDTAMHAVLDIGGDDRGAYALGRYAPAIVEENNFDMLFVVNFFRPLTRTPEEALTVMREIEAAGKVPFTGLVNNSNLGELSSPSDLISTDEAMQTLAQKSGLPIRFCSATPSVCAALSATGNTVSNALFPLTLQEKYFEIKEYDNHGKGHF